LGTAIWAIALIVECARSAPTPDIWICVVGLLFGALGMLDIARRERRENSKKAR
jgi:hypothetical protein